MPTGATPKRRNATPWPPSPTEARDSAGPAYSTTSSSPGPASSSANPPRRPPTPPPPSPSPPTSPPPPASGPASAPSSPPPTATATSPRSPTSANNSTTPSPRTNPPEGDYRSTMNVSAVFFHATGYLRLPHLFDAGQVAALRGAAHQIAEAGHKNVERSPERTRIDSVVSLDSNYIEVATSRSLQDVLEPVLGPNIELIENRHNHVSIYHVPRTDRL